MVEEHVKKVVEKFLKQPITRNLGLLLMKPLEIKPSDYKRFNQLKRTGVQEVVLKSMLSALERGETEELNDEARDLMQAFPRISQEIDVKSDDYSLKILEAFDDVKIEGDRVYYDDPPDPWLTLLKLIVNPFALQDYLKRYFGSDDLRDYADKFSVAIQNHLKEIFGERYVYFVYQLIFQLSRLYGVSPIKRLKAEDVYLKGYEFYKSHENQSTITFSVSSGLLDPLERYGIDEFIRRYSIALEKVDDIDILLKNPYRIHNFPNGILNKEINTKRIYIWEREGTSEALKKALHLVPKDQKQRFLDDAVILLSEAFMLDKIKIFEIEKFDPWMKMFTRNAKDEIIFSIRGKNSKKITHALQIFFDLEVIKKRKQLLQLISRLIGQIKPLAGLILFVLGEGFYLLVKSTLKKVPDFEEELPKNGILIKDYGKSGKTEAYRKAEEVIERLIS